MQRAADRLDHYAYQLRKLHDAEFGQNWRHESRQDTANRVQAARPTLRAEKLAYATSFSARKRARARPWCRSDS